MPITKAKCNFSHTALEGIFDKGDIVNIEPVLSTKRIFVEDEPETSENMIVDIGDYLGFRIKSKDGNYYNDHTLYCVFGYKTLKDLFVKV